MLNKEKTIKEKMELLCADFAANASNAITQLELLAAKLCAGEVSSDILHGLHNNLHRLAGSAGTFGFRVLGEETRLLDTQVLNWMDNDLITDLEEFSGFAASVSKLKNHLSIEDSNMAAEVEKALSGEKSANGNERLQILVVDDDQFQCQLMATLLMDSFDVVTAYSGEEALTSFMSLKPDITLLDIEMPDMDGYHVCERIKQEVPLEWRSIIFVSGCDSLGERMAAYDAGGDDFIAKPFHSGEFVAKLKTLADYTRTKKEVAEQAKITQTLVIDVMNESAQYGGLVEFLQRAMRCDSVDSLVDLFFETTEKYGLKTSLRLRGEEIKCITYERLPCSPIEMNLFDLTSNEGRLYHFGNRTMVKDTHVSFFVKNMPIKNEKEYGRIKDVIAALSEAMESAFLMVQKKEALTNMVTHVAAIKETLATVYSPNDCVGQFNDNSDVGDLMDVIEELNSNVERLSENLRISNA